MQIKTPKKLIETALPLDAINAACAYEKMPGIGPHPRGIHLWWARRPLAAARAVLFAQMVNDPGYERQLGRGINKEKAAIERERLFDIIRKLVLWENTNNEDVLREARAEIVKSWKETCALNKAHAQSAELFNPDKLPAFHDPFSGGGALPLEAQRLGLEAYASDLNPVAVMINKAMIEIPPRFSGLKPVGPIPAGEKQHTFHDDWGGTAGLAEDIRRYGSWMRQEAQKRIGHLYPKIEVTAEVVEKRPDLKPLSGEQLTVIAWLWARTVKSPNPAYSHVDVPLVASFWLSNKEGKEVWIDPIKEAEGYRFEVRFGGKPTLVETVNRRGGVCLMSGTPMDFKYIRAEGQAGRMGQRLMGIVAEGKRGRVYLSATDEHEAIARRVRPEWMPDMPLPDNPRDFKTPNYGLMRFGDLFTPRQLVALNAFSDLVTEAMAKIKVDALAAGMPDDGFGLEKGGNGATAYAEAVSVFLAFAVDRCADFSNSCTRWVPGNQKVMNLFGKQAIAMTWDYPEAAVLEDTVGGLFPAAEYIAECVKKLPQRPGLGIARQENAAANQSCSGKVISTDPPYYDNIGYADLSDFFYIWLRRSLKTAFPALFTTLAVPKAEELVATPYRHGSKENAEKFFLDGMTLAIHNLAEQAHPAFPVTIYYAFKQSETEGDGGTSSTGWETFLEAVLRSGFAITGTWPMRSEQSHRMIGMGANALASSIVLVCKKRAPDAEKTSRREFLRELNALLPEALDEMTRGGVNSPVAPVDLSQSIIGPGIAIFSKYSAVLEADGSPMRVKTALQLINRFLAEDDFDHDTQFCLHWFETRGWAEGKFGDADVLARAKGTSVSGVAEAGVVESGKGAVRLLRYAEYPSDWSPESDTRVPIWEALHQMIRSLQDQDEAAAGALLSRMPARAEPIRQLAYRLYTLCERKGWAEDARAYNELITSWSAIETASQEAGPVNTQAQLEL